MPRVKRVRFVSIAEHLRIRQRLQEEVDAWRAVYESMREDVNDLEMQVRNMMRSARHVLRSRANLHRRRDMVLGACGTPGCRALVYRHWMTIGGLHRRCRECRARDHAEFRATQAAILTAAPVSPSHFLAIDDDSQSTVSI